MTITGLAHKITDSPPTECCLAITSICSSRFRRISRSATSFARRGTLVPQNPARVRAHPQALSGARFWGRVYFSTTAGNITDDIIMCYLDQHIRKDGLSSSTSTGVSPTVVQLLASVCTVGPREPPARLRRGAFNIVCQLKDRGSTDSDPRTEPL